MPIPALAANPKAGGSCTKFGKVQVFEDKKFTCVKSGKKLKWNKGISVKSSDYIDEATAAIDKMVEEALAKKNAEETARLEAEAAAEKIFLMQKIADSSWSLSGVLDGYFVALNSISDISYHSTEVWQSLKESGAFTKVSSGTFPKIQVTYYADLSKKWVKIRHVTKSGKFTDFSSVKIISSLDPSGYDTTGPTNNTVPITYKIGRSNNSVGTFNQQITISWSPSKGKDIASYKIGFKISSDDQYTFTSSLELNSPKVTFDGLTQSQKYDFVIFSQDVYGNLSKEPIGLLKGILLNS